MEAVFLKQTKEAFDECTALGRIDRAGIRRRPNDVGQDARDAVGKVGFAIVIEKLLKGCPFKFFDHSRRHPDIKEAIEALFLKKVDRIMTVHESVIPFKSIHKRFVDACRGHGVKMVEYPFTCKWLGYPGLVKHLTRLAVTRYGDATKARFGREAARNLRLGRAAQPLMPATRPYFRVEFDGHKVDISFVIKIPTPYGHFEDRVVNRLWILVIRETLTGAILGYHVAYGLEYNQHEVCQCIKKSIQPWVPRQLTTPGLSYPTNGGIALKQLLQGASMAALPRPRLDRRNAVVLLLAYVWHQSSEAPYSAIWVSRDAF